jgi:hypothetical protein
MSAPAKTASKAALNLESRSRMKNRIGTGVVAEVHQRVAGCGLARWTPDLTSGP